MDKNLDRAQGPGEATIRSPDPRELFDRGLELFARGQVEASVATLREAFFGNLSIAPALLGMPADAGELWLPGPSASAEAAKDYARDKRRDWQAVPNGLRYLRCLWDDPLIRREIRSYTNFCKSYRRAPLDQPKVSAELTAERAKFTNERRIRSTQKEILDRIREYRFDLPPKPPRLSTVTLISPKAEAAAEFLRRVLGAAPMEHASTGSYSVALEGLTLRLVRGEGSPTGVELTVEVDDFDYYVRRIEDEAIDPIAAQTTAPRNRYLVVSGPGGLLVRLVARDEESA
jgi:hypothetical protein